MSVKKYFAQILAITVGIALGLTLIFFPLIQGIKGPFLEATLGQVWEVFGQVTVGQIIGMLFGLVFILFGLVFIRGLAELVPDFPTAEIKEDVK